MVDVIKRTLDCNPVFHENVVSVNQMIGIMLGSIAVFGIIYYYLLYCYSVIGQVTIIKVTKGNLITDLN